MRIESSVRILHINSTIPICLFCNFPKNHYIGIELFDELQSAAVQRSYKVAKSLPTTFFLSALLCHSDRYMKVFYQYKDSIFSAKTDNIRSKFYEIIHVESTSVAESP